MNEIVIRKVTENDIEAIVEIQVDSWKTAYQGIIDDAYLENFDKEEKIAKRKKDYQQYGFVVPCIDDEIVGFCRYVNTNEFSKQYSDVDCELCALYVKPNWKRNGIGKKLFLYVVNEFIKQGKSKMILWCFKENYPARMFYEKMGGQKCAEKKEKFGEKEYEEVAYRYDLRKIDFKGDEEKWK